MARPTSISEILATGTPNWSEPEPCRITLGVCGKIPAYNDHISYGMTTPTLKLFEDWYYGQELRKQIETEGVETMELLPLSYTFACFGTNDLLLGCVTPSVDGRGRDNYPLVCVAHVHRGGSLRFDPQFIDAVLRPLPGLCETLKAGTGRGFLEQAVAQVEKEMRDRSDEFLKVGKPGDDQERDAICEDNKEEALARILWSLDSQLPRETVFQRKLFPAAELPEAHTRLPCRTETISLRLSSWSFFFFAAVQGNLPLFLFSGQGSDWLDLYAGKPSSELFFRHRLSSKVFPIASNIPFAIDLEFLDESRDFAGKLREKKAVGERFSRSFLEWLRGR